MREHYTREPVERAQFHIIVIKQYSPKEEAVTASATRKDTLSSLFEESNVTTNMYATHHQ